jgi:mono/diheme cytochrome c family protein
VLAAQSGTSTSGTSTPGTSTRDGVYTAAQAEQGQTLFTQQCAVCHGATLQGTGQNPPLTGDAFLKNWTGSTLADFYGMIQATMPATKPGSLTPDQVTQAIAFILQSNKFPAGNTELPNTPDALKAIHFDKP